VGQITSDPGPAGETGPRVLTVRAVPPKVQALRKSRRLLTLGLLAASLARPSDGSPPDEPAPPIPAPAPAAIPIFLDPPADRDAFWRMLGHPDFAELDGGLYRDLARPAWAPRAVDRPPAAIVEALAVTGEVADDRARLVIEYRIAVQGDGTAWVPIRLDGLTLSGAREGDRDLATRATEGRSWEVELDGRGEHRLRVELLAPVRSTAEGRRLDVPIPPASSTRFDLDVPGHVVDARTGINEPVAVGSRGVEGGARLAARLSPRSRIELAWRERTDPAVGLPVLLSAQGEIAVEVERGLIRARSSWSVAAIRGSADRIGFRLDAAEEVVDVEVDGRPVPFQARPDQGRSLVEVPLAEPLRANSPRSLAINTRRPIAAVGTARVTLQGYAFDRARVHAGVVVIAQNGPIFLNPSPGRGLRRIDPRTELPEGLRLVPHAALAFEFNEEPFDLGLGIEPAPPRLRVEARTTVTVEPRSARIDTRLECRASQGSPFDLRVILPRGLDFDRAEPPDLVASAQSVPIAPGAGPGGVDAPRLLSIALTPKAREADSFAIRLQGRCEIDPSRPVVVPLFQPQVDASTGGRIVVVTDRNVSVEPGGSGDEPSPFRVEWGAPASDWIWPDRPPGAESGLLWLRYDADPDSMPIRVAVRPRTIRHESTMTAAVDRRGADITEEISGEVAFGTLSRLDVALPPEVPTRWDVEGAEVEGREPLGRDPDGGRRYRLRFARGQVEAFRLRVRYRVPFREPLSAGRDDRLRLEPIRVLEGTSTGRQVRLAAAPGLEIGAEARGWDAVAIPEGSTTAEAGPPVRSILTRVDEKAGPVAVSARLGARQQLPSLVVSRLWIRAVQRPEDDLATTAYFWVETRDGSMTIGLPTGSRPVRARVGGSDVVDGEVEVVAADEYRIRFPAATAPGPVLVEVDYLIPAGSARDGWPPPRLLGGGVVQQTVWEVRLLGSRAGVGTPSGWTDENEWYWDGLLWRRRPRKSPAELYHWLGAGNLRYRIADPLESGEQGGRHGYLFSRPGPPSTLRFPVFSRFALLLLCSGPIMLAGLLVLARRPPPRLVGLTLVALAFAIGAFVDPDATILIVQSAMLGVVLLLASVAMNWALVRREGARPADGRVMVVTPSAAGSSISIAGGIGSDDPTAIRPRPAVPPAASTADHVAPSTPPGRPAGEPTSNRDHR